MDFDFLCFTRLAHSADVYNLHGAKRLVTIPNVLSASRPSVNQDVKNKPFLHIDCYTFNTFNFLAIQFSPRNSASSFFNRFIFQLFVNRVHSCGAVSGTSRTHMPTLWKLTLIINLFQLNSQDLALSNDMHVFLQMTSIMSAILITARGV